MRRFIAALLCLIPAAVLAGGGPRNVLVVQNINSPIASEIVSHYVSARGIPLSNICKIRCSTAESISQTEYELIANDIRGFLANPANAAVASQIDYIVVTKGMPLKVNNPSYGTLSLTSMLTCLSEPPGSLNPTDPGITAPITNPYGPTAAVKVRKAFSHQIAFTVSSKPRHLYLVTRLDAHSLEDVIAMIDGSIAAAPAGYFAIDCLENPQSNFVALNNLMVKANTDLLAKGFSTIYDKTPQMLAGLTNLMGYVGWGSNDYYFGVDAVDGLARYRSNRFIPGSIAETFVSSSGRTFTLPTAVPPTLIGDLITQGCCGVSGYVYEPYTNFCTQPDTVFNMYTDGYNMAEAFYMATPKLYWRSVVVGDPLMAPYAIRPTVVVNTPLEPLTGTGYLSAGASDPSGITKVDFYVDDEYVGSATQSPYMVPLDTTAYTVGIHTVEAVATQASVVANQSAASGSIEIRNPISNLEVISDAFPSPDGQGIRAASKIVTAGTNEMEPGEFYMQEEDGSSGMRVLTTESVTTGAIVTVVGDLITENGERTVIANDIDIINYMLGEPKAVAMRNSSVGGKAMGDYTPGVTGAVDLRNLGLLIRTFGKVTYSGGVGEEFFYVDDGSKCSDGSGKAGIKINCRDFLKPPPGGMVSVTGISASEKIGEKIVPVVRMRRQSDLTVLQ